MTAEIESGHRGPKPRGPLLVWFDLETTGLTPGEHVVLEVGAVLTDGEGAELWRYTSTFPLAPTTKVTAEIAVMHGGPAGLLDDALSERAMRSPGEPDAAAVADRVMAEAVDHFQAELDTGRVYLAGTNVSFDRSFAVLWFPELVKRLSYRQIDVTTLLTAEAVVQSAYVASERPPHRALPDCLRALEVWRRHLRRLAVVGAS